jgi:hypothetical protein
MEETDLLRGELESFRRERKRVRRVIAQIGGNVSQSRERAINAVFLTAVGLLFAVSLAREVLGLDIAHLSATLSMEIAVLLVSLKIAWMMRRQTRVDHFQFWILNSIEFRIDAIDRRLAELQKNPPGAGSEGPARES